MAENDIPPDDQREGGETADLPWLMLAREAVYDCIRERAKQVREYGTDPEAPPYEVREEAVIRIGRKLVEQIPDSLPMEEQLVACKLVIGQLLKAVITWAPPDSEPFIPKGPFPDL